MVECFSSVLAVGSVNLTGISGEFLIEWVRGEGCKDRLYLLKEENEDFSSSSRLKISI